MTVKELIEQLSKIEDQNRGVVMNLGWGGQSPLKEVDADDWHRPKWPGEAVKAVVLYPVG